MRIFSYLHNDQFAISKFPCYNHTCSCVSMTSSPTRLSPIVPPVPMEMIPCCHDSHSTWLLSHESRSEVLNVRVSNVVPSLPNTCSNRNVLLYEIYDIAQNELLKIKNTWWLDLVRCTLTMTAVVHFADATDLNYVHFQFYPIYQIAYRIALTGW